MRDKEEHLRQSQSDEIDIASPSRASTFIRAEYSHNTILIAFVNWPRWELGLLLAVIRNL